MGTRVNYLPRAERYAIPIAILYRSPGELDWQPGLTENISRSGLLFRAERRLEPNTPLEIMVDLPTIVAASAAGHALRRGRVVRALPPSPLENRPAVAAAFIDFQHTPPIDPRRI
jgi:PilZ domain